MDAVLSGQVKNLDWRVRDAAFIAALLHATIDEVLQKLATLLSPSSMM